MTEISDLLGGFFIGVIASISATLIYWYFSDRRRKTLLKKKFGKAEGNYLGFGYSKEAPNQKLGRQQSIATIKYLKDNMLSFKLNGRNDPIQYQWKGIITMELENYGSMSWKYTIFDGVDCNESNTHIFGFKKVMINDNGNNFYIYLVDATQEGYEKEVLKKVE